MPARGSTVSGPFAVFDRQFVVESQERDLVDTIADGYVDLAVADDLVDPVTYRVERTGPAWYPHGWRITRGGELIGGEALGTFLPTLIASDAARHFSHGTAGATVNGVAVARGDRAVLLVVDVIARGAHTHDAPLDLPALAALSMRHGWGLVALDVVAVASTGDGALLRSFHRPFAPEPKSPLATLLGSAGRPLVPASLVGALVDDTPVSAIVAVRAAADGVTRLEAASPSAMLRALAAQLTGDADRRRHEFRRLADVVEQLPGRTLHLGHDHDAAIAELAGAT